MASLDIPDGFGMNVPGASAHLSYTKNGRGRNKLDATMAKNGGWGPVRVTSGRVWLSKRQLDQVRDKYIECRFNATQTAKFFAKFKVTPGVVNNAAKKGDWKGYAALLESKKTEAVIQNTIQDEVVARAVTVNFIDQRIEWIKKNHGEKVPKDVDSAVDKLARLRELLIGNADSRAGMDKKAVMEYLRSLTPEQREELAQEWDAQEAAKKT